MSCELHRRHNPPYGFVIGNFEAIRQLTPESTEAHIGALRRSGGIVLFEPSLLPHEAYRRRLWLRPDVHRWVSRAGTSRAETRYHAEVRAFLKGFVTGEDFDDDDMLKALKPATEGIWALRITLDPQARIFGGFLRPGEFVGTNWHDRGRLAGEGFAEHRSRSARIWSTLFGAMPRLTRVARNELLEDFDVDGL